MLGVQDRLRGFPNGLHWTEGPPDLSLPPSKFCYPFSYMKSLLVVLGLSVQLYAAIQIGDKAPSLCLQNELAQKECLADSVGKIRVLVYNTGWCKDCQTEMQVFVPETVKYAGKDVHFLSLSVEGWKVKDAPSTQFLLEWKDKHQISFSTLASPKDPGKFFFDPPYSVPSLVILDKTGVMVYRTQDIDLKEVFQKIDSLL